ncbi:drug resistance transporter, EmrB/QacA subfamily [Glycomyces sambucus]|uniref:Drug resistance transporter, EmrB/QacA subfamily n=1 Tax=Glycomyces sambucus TaxID=380244 RepID=A0A1G9CNC9_9ACTN|nr:MFS transporter [Glycomyces sambucus]SDK53190.1 drug resistance transporter, EmrB/QacA subfamily [Glycomyces sambucus]
MRGTATRTRTAPTQAGERGAKWLLAVTSLGSGLVLLEGTVVTVALPAIESELHASTAQLQWTVNAFALTLSALVLTGGGIGDRFGRRRAYLAGVLIFGAASLLCGTAPTTAWLLAGRALQGIGGALIVPGSLALLQSAVPPADRARAIGWWAGLSGVAGAAGPLIGGALTDAAGWRSIFLVNLPLAAVIAVLLLKCVPRDRERTETRPFDVRGAVLAALGLGALAFAATATSPRTGVIAGALGATALAAFLIAEHRSAAPMLPLWLFRSRRFTTAGVTGFLAYGALAGVFFLVPIQLQLGASYSAAAAGLAMVPLTALTLVVAPLGGELASRFGHRGPLLAGSLSCAAAALWASRIGAGASYAADVLPVMLLIGIGIPLITPPVTAAALDAVPQTHTGIAGAVGNAVARVAGLLVVAVLPAATGLPQDLAADTAALDHGFEQAMLACAGLFLMAGVTAWIGLAPDRRRRSER